MKLRGPLTCKQCGKVDHGRAGTTTTMSCPDCNQGKLNSYGKPLAEYCRDCCPTGHSTRGEVSQ